MISIINTQPRQQVPYKSKGLKWRRLNIDFADNKLLYDRSKIRLDFYLKTINIDLLNGKIHIDDIIDLINPEGIKAKFISKTLLHYPIINRKVALLVGEESKRLDLWSIRVTNANAISEIELTKKELILQTLQLEIQDSSQTDEEFNLKMEKLNDFYTFEYLDIREVKANCLLNHYTKELNHALIFNNGFKDAIAVGEELYFIDIVAGEPCLRKLNTKFVKLYMSTFSNKAEDADMVIITDYMSLGQIYDEFGDVLTKKDLDYLETRVQDFATGNVDGMDNWDERRGFVPITITDDIPTADDIFNDNWDSVASFLPYDSYGNFRVLRVFWKSRRKLLKVKYYDKETGELLFKFRTEDYIPNESIGEEAEPIWINEAWEGTKIGELVYVNIRPRPVLFNRMSNPSRCHFGIIGTIYNFNDDKPYSLVEMAKPFAYMYDVVHDRLNKMMARNWGKMTRLNLALKPATWDVDKWLYFARTMGLYVEDGFNEGNYGASTGKMAGAMNMNSNGVIDADFGNNIQLYINFLMYLEQEMSDAIGISKQREGLISNRETVGGVERATLQSSHITEQYYLIHDDTKKRVREAFLEITKACLKGRNKKFLYILPDYSVQTIEIDGDEFAECDYGLVLDNSNGLLELQQKLETLAQAALLNQSLSFSTIMKLFMSCSLAEKQRFVENDERRIQELQQLMLQLLMLMQQQQQQALLQLKLMELLQQDTLNQRDNETKIMVAEINSQAEMAILQLKNHMTESDLQDKLELIEYNKLKLLNDMESLDKKMQLLKELENSKLRQLLKLFEANLKFQLDKAKKEQEIKLKSINKSKTN